MAGAYAAVLALLGAVLGLAAGLIPGVAAAVALTRNGFNGGYASSVPGGAGDGSRLDLVAVPWLLVAALLVVLPLAAGALAALSARGRMDVSTRRRA